MAAPGLLDVHSVEEQFLVSVIGRSSPTAVRGSCARPRLHVNGKWLTQPLTGTHRYATEVFKEIAATRAAQLVLHVPAKTEVPAWIDEGAVEIRRAPVNGVIFEQLFLPFASAGSLLINLSGPAPILKKRQVVTMHDATPFRFPRTFRFAFVAFYFVMYKLLGRYAFRLVTVSQFSARELSAILRIRQSRFVVASAAADALASVAPKKPDLVVDAPYYLFIGGTLAKNKNLKTSTDAVVQSGRRAVIVGAQDSQQVFRHDRMVASACVTTGRLADSELVWLYRNAVALICPSTYEGFGLPPLEAQTLECPVVSASRASLPEVLGDGAIYFDPDETTSLLAALDSLENDSQFVADMCRRGKENSRRFEWRNSAQAILRSIGVESTAPVDARTPEI